MWPYEVHKHQRRISLLLSARISTGQIKNDLHRYAACASVQEYAFVGLFKFCFLMFRHE